MLRILMLLELLVRESCRLAVHYTMLCNFLYPCNNYIDDWCNDSLCSLCTVGNWYRVHLLSHEEEKLLRSCSVRLKNTKITDLLIE